MDYGKMETEMKSAGAGNTFKPGIGMHQVIFLSEAEETEFVDEQGKKTPQIKFSVEVNKQQMDWYIAKGKTTQSIYGQIIKLGVTWKQLTGKTITILVNEIVEKDKKRKTYQIVEYLKLQQEQKTAEQAAAVITAPKTV